MAISMQRSRPRPTFSRSNCRSAGTPAHRSRRAVPLARFDADRDVLELYGAAKVPHRTRDNLARILGTRADVGAP
jgi:hypothetical protein